MSSDATVESVTQIGEGSTLFQVGRWFLTTGLLLVAAFGPLGNTSLGLLAMIVGTVTWTATSAGRILIGQRLQAMAHTPIPWFLGAMLLSAVTSPVPLAAWGIALAYAVMWGAIWIAVPMLHAPAMNRRWFRLLTISGAVASVIAIGGYLFFHVDRAHTGIVGFMGLASLLIVVSCTGAGYLRSVKSVCWLPYLALTTAALVLTFARGAWIGFAVALFLYTVFNRRLLVAAGGFMVVVSQVLWLVPRLRVQLISRLSTFDNGRFGIWSTVFSMFRHNPILGVGMGVHPMLYSQYLLPGAMPGAGHAHNWILGMAADVGLVGLSMFLWLMGQVLGKLWTPLRWGDTLHRALAAGLMGMLVHQLFDIPVYGVEVGGFFWVLVFYIYTQVIPNPQHAEQ